ncbi:MAG: stage II sporulation protein M [Candidatus Hydrothermarchaeales archaeon]
MKPSGLMRHVRHATLLFLSGGIVGAILGYFGETTPAFLSWKFSLLELNRGILALIANNLVAAFITALGPFIVAKVFRITSADSEGIAFLYMIPTLVLFLNGFSTGYFMGTLVTNVTLFLILLSIVPHGIFEIPAIILSGAIGLRNIEEVDSAKFVGRSLLFLVIFLILLGGYVEGNVTSHLSSLSTPIEIITLEGQKEVSAGVEFPVSIVVKNHGIKQGEYYLSISASSGERSYNELSLELGTTISERTFTIYSPGLQNYTVAVIREGGVVTQRKSSIQVKEPNVEITGTFVPELFAGEDTVIEISIENHDDVKRDAILVFSSSTGAINQRSMSLEAGENLTYEYSTEIGQPGKRRFEIALV